MSAAMSIDTDTMAADIQQLADSLAEDDRLCIEELCRRIKMDERVGERYRPFADWLASDASDAFRSQFTEMSVDGLIEMSEIPLAVAAFLESTASGQDAETSQMQNAAAPTVVSSRVFEDSVSSSTSRSSSTSSSPDVTSVQESVARIQRGDEFQRVSDAAHEMRVAEVETAPSNNTAGINLVSESATSEQDVQNVQMDSSRLLVTAGLEGFIETADAALIAEGPRVANSMTASSTQTVAATSSAEGTASAGDAETLQAQFSLGHFPAGSQGRADSAQDQRLATTRISENTASASGVISEQGKSTRGQAAGGPVRRADSARGKIGGSNTATQGKLARERTTDDGLRERAPRAQGARRAQSKTAPSNNTAASTSHSDRATSAKQFNELRGNSALEQGCDGSQERADPLQREGMMQSESASQEQPARGQGNALPQGRVDDAQEVRSARANTPLEKLERQEMTGRRQRRGDETQDARPLPAAKPVSNPAVSTARSAGDFDDAHAFARRQPTIARIPGTLDVNECAGFVGSYSRQQAVAVPKSQQRIDPAPGCGSQLARRTPARSKSAVLPDGADNMRAARLNLDGLFSVVRQSFKVAASVLSDQELIKLFQLLDANGSGSIDLAELCKFLGFENPISPPRACRKVEKAVQPPWRPAGEYPKLSEGRTATARGHSPGSPQSPRTCSPSSSTACLPAYLPSQARTFTATATRCGESGTPVSILTRPTPEASYAPGGSHLAKSRSQPGFVKHPQPPGPSSCRAGGVLRRHDSPGRAQSATPRSRQTQQTQQLPAWHSSSRSLAKRKQFPSVEALNRLHLRLLSAIGLRKGGLKDFVKLLIKFDAQKAGLLSFAEFQDLVRKDLCVAMDSMSDEDIDALAAALDCDCAGSVSTDEILDFVTRGPEKFYPASSSRNLEPSPHPAPSFRSEQHEVARQADEAASGGWDEQADARHAALAQMMPAWDRTDRQRCQTELLHSGMAAAESTSSPLPRCQGCRATVAPSAEFCPFCGDQVQHWRDTERGLYVQESPIHRTQHSPRQTPRNLTTTRKASPSPSWQYHRGAAAGERPRFSPRVVPKPALADPLYRCTQVDSRQISPRYVNQLGGCEWQPPRGTRPWTPTLTVGRWPECARQEHTTSRPRSPPARGRPGDGEARRQKGARLAHGVLRDVDEPSPSRLGVAQGNQQERVPHGIKHSSGGAPSQSRSVSPASMRSTSHSLDTLPLTTQVMATAGSPRVPSPRRSPASPSAHLPTWGGQNIRFEVVDAEPPPRWRPPSPFNGFAASQPCMRQPNRADGGASRARQPTSRSTSPEVPWQSPPRRCPQSPHASGSTRARSSGPSSPCSVRSPPSQDHQSVCRVAPLSSARNVLSTSSSRVTFGSSRSPSPRRGERNPGSPPRAQLTDERVQSSLHAPRSPQARSNSPDASRNGLRLSPQSRVPTSHAQARQRSSSPCADQQPYAYQQSKFSGPQRARSREPSGQSEWLRSMPVSPRTLSECSRNSSPNDSSTHARGTEQMAGFASRNIETESVRQCLPFLDICAALSRELKKSCKSFEEVRQRLLVALGERPSKQRLVEFIAGELGFDDGAAMYAALASALGSASGLPLSELLSGIESTWKLGATSSSPALEYADCSPYRMDAHLDHVARVRVAGRMKQDRDAGSLGGQGVRSRQRCAGTPKAAAQYTSSFRDQGVAPLRGRQASLARSASPVRLATPTGSASPRSCTQARGSKSASPSRQPESSIFDRLHAVHAAKLQARAKAEEEFAQKEAEEAEVMASRTVKKTSDKPEQVAERVWNASIEHRQRQAERIQKDEKKHRRFLKENNVSRGRTGAPEEEIDRLCERLHADRARIDASRTKQLKEKEERELAELQANDVRYLHSTKEEAASVKPEEVVERIFNYAEASKRRSERKRQQLEEQSEEKRLQEADELQKKIEYESVKLRHIADPTMKLKPEEWRAFIKRMDAADERSKVRRKHLQAEQERTFDELRSRTAPSTPRSPGVAARNANKLYEDADHRRQRQRIWEEALLEEERRQLFQQSVHRHAEGDAGIFQHLYEDAARRKNLYDDHQVTSPAKARVTKGRRDDHNPIYVGPSVAAAGCAEETWQAQRSLASEQRRESEERLDLEVAPSPWKLHSRDVPRTGAQRKLVLQNEAIEEPHGCLSIARMLEHGVKQWSDQKHSKRPKHGWKDAARTGELELSDRRRPRSPQGAPRRAG